MSENILDISKWTPNYPFINTIWHTYHEFDKDVDDLDKNKNNFYVLCNQIINKSNGDLSAHTDICMKLMRNLGVYSLDTKIYRPNYDRCNILYNWIYNLINKNKITENVINKCFVEYNSYMNDIGNEKRCYHYSNDKIYEPIKITLLDIFDNNTPIIKDTLMDRNISISAPGRKYVCECVKIYKQMNDAYCLNEKGKQENYNSTCLKLKHFKGVYNFFRSALGELNPSLPSLNDSDNEFLVKCPSEKPNNLLTPERAKNPEGTSRTDVFQDTEDNGRKFEGDLPSHSETDDSPMKATITTTIGTVAGASSLLAFLYKFTPAKRLVYSGLRGSRRRIDNNFYEEGHNELLFDAFEGDDMNPQNTRYNIGYGTEGIY